MRLWSLHPKYLDAKGLVACWREGLLARKVLLGETRGYRNHPQLARFKSSSEPIATIDTYLMSLAEEAVLRGYGFDQTKIGPQFTRAKIEVTSGQLVFELEHLKAKLKARDPAMLKTWTAEAQPSAHPLFHIVEGGIEDWERG